MSECSWLTAKNYELVQQLVPFICVDLFIEYPDGYVWVRRNKTPDKGKYTTPGGRVRRDESIPAAINRIALNEVFIDVTDIQFMGIAEMLQKERHTISLFFYCKPKLSTILPTYDENHSKYTLSHIPPTGTTPIMVQMWERLKEHKQYRSCCKCFYKEE